MSNNTNSSPAITYLASLLWTAIPIIIILPLVSLLDLKAAACKIFILDPDCFGKFFYWELATIIHTIVIFILFTNSKELDDLLTHRQRNNSIAIVSMLFIVMLVLYYVALSNHKEGGNYYLLRDSISYMPICIFFITNVIFLFRNWKDSKKRKVFTKMIIMLDLPFFLPYLIILYFVVQNLGSMKVHDYLAGVSTIVLMSSNLVSAAFNSYKNEPSTTV